MNEIIIPVSPGESRDQRSIWRLVFQNGRGPLFLFTMISGSQLHQIFPQLSLSKAMEFVGPLAAAMMEFEINTPKRIAAFLGQLAEESAQLTHWEENLNYSSPRLLEVWPTRFPTASSTIPFAHNPKALANKVYGGRLGNKPGTDDGWIFRGRCPIQATGRDMYATLSQILGRNLLNDPDALSTPEIGFRAAAAIFAKIKGCNMLADKIAVDLGGSVKLITHQINGGYNGLQNRIAVTRKALALLSTAEPASAETPAKTLGEQQKPPEVISANSPSSSDAPPSNPISEKDDFLSAAIDANLSGDVKTAAISGFQKAVLFLTKPLSRAIIGIGLSLAAGDFWAWLGVIAIGGFIIFEIYWNRRLIAAGLAKIIAKLKAKFTEK